MNIEHLQSSSFHQQDIVHLWWASNSVYFNIGLQTEQNYSNSNSNRSKCIDYVAITDRILLFWAQHNLDWSFKIEWKDNYYITWGQYDTSIFSSNSTTLFLFEFDSKSTFYLSIHWNCVVMQIYCLKAKRGEIFLILLRQINVIVVWKSMFNSDLAADIEWENRKFAYFWIFCYLILLFKLVASAFLHPKCSVLGT